MIGEVGVVLSDLTPSGRIKVRGEIWNAWSRTPIRVGARVRIVTLHGLEAEVVPEADEARSAGQFQGGVR